MLDSDRVQLLYRNAMQIKRIVEATYTSQDFKADGSSSDHAPRVYDQSDSGSLLAGDWQRVVGAMARDKDDTKQAHLNKVRGLQSTKSSDRS